MHGDSRGPRAVAGRSAWSASDSGRDVALTSATHGRGPVVLWAIVPIRLRLLGSGGAREPRRSNTLLARPLPRSMHQDTATVMPRSSGALPLSPLQANVAEFRPRTLAADELRKRRWRPPLLHESDSLLRAARPAAHWPLGRQAAVAASRAGQQPSQDQILPVPADRMLVAGPSSPFACHECIRYLAGPSNRRRSRACGRIARIGRTDSVSLMPSRRSRRSSGPLRLSTITLGQPLPSVHPLLADVPALGLAEHETQRPGRVGEQHLGSAQELVGRPADSRGNAPDR
jgi:hypothetical protein